MSLASWNLAGGDVIAPGLTAVKTIGGGNAYEAFLAFDERLYAPVVVKVVRPDQVDNAETLDGLDREVAMLQRLNHPGIVRMFSYERDSTRPHIVLENIDGPTLSKLISSYGALPLPQLLPLGIELASALHYMRESDTCHLDIKPSNIIMGAPAKLIDLSIARDVKEAGELDHRLGSDEYMAPEQCRPGELGQVGHASDMWAAGATLFRAAAGYRAFDRNADLPQIDQDPYGLPDFVPGVVGDLILSCLDKDPGNRPLPIELAESIEPLMERLPTARLSGFKLGL